MGLFSSVILVFSLAEIPFDTYFRSNAGSICLDNIKILLRCGFMSFE